MISLVINSMMAIAYCIRTVGDEQDQMNATGIAGVKSSPNNQNKSTSVTTRAVWVSRD